jgi:hypothetical protein
MTESAAFSWLASNAEELGGNQYSTQELTLSDRQPGGNESLTRNFNIGKNLVTKVLSI